MLTVFLRHPGFHLMCTESCWRDRGASLENDDFFTSETLLVMRGRTSGAIPLEVTNLSEEGVRDVQVHRRPAPACDGV